MSITESTNASRKFIAISTFAGAIGISGKDASFAKIWQRIAIVASLIREEGRNGSMTIGVNGINIQITSKNTKIRNSNIYDNNGGFLSHDVLLSEEIIPLIEKAYFEYAPNSSLTPTDSDALKKGRYVTSTDNPSKKRPIIYIKIPEKTNDMLIAEEIADYLGAPVGTIRKKLQSIREEYDKYWIEENNYNLGSSSVNKTRPEPIIEVQINERGISRGNSKTVMLKIPQDVTVARFEKGRFRTERAFCVNKDKVKFLFPELYLQMIFKKHQIEIEQGENLYTSRTFCEKLLPGIDRTSFERLMLEVKEQYDALLVKGKKPSDVNWKELGIFIDGAAIPASVFCYGKMVKDRFEKFGFFIKEEALSYISSIPEVSARLNKNNDTWLNVSKANTYFGNALGIIGDDIEVQKNFRRAHRLLGEILEAREEWLEGMRERIASSGGILSSYDSNAEYFDYSGIRIKAVDTCHTAPSGGAKGFMAKRNEFIKLFDTLDFTVKKLENKTKKTLIPRNCEHWFDFALRLQDSVPANLRALVGNLSIISLAEMVQEPETLVHKYSSDEMHTTYLNFQAKQELLSKVLENVEQSFGYVLEIPANIIAAPKVISK